VQTGITVSGDTQDLGTITWAPTNHTTFLWQIGRADRMTGEFALATLSPVDPAPRSFEKPSLVPGDLTFTISDSWEPTDWYYFQNTPGTWTVSFTLDRAYTGTAFLTGSFALSGGRPAVAVNGSTTGVTNALPSQNDGGVGRQNDRSAFPRVGVVTFPASALVVGTNTVTFTVTRTGGGPGYDTLLLELDEDVAPQPAKLNGFAVQTSGSGGTATWHVTVRNIGKGDANDVRIDAVSWLGASHGPLATPPKVVGRDPNKFPVPVINSLPPHGEANFDLTVDASGTVGGFGGGVVASMSANGGRARFNINAGYERM
jgi:rhamnogalacturonan endolyase